MSIEMLKLELKNLEVSPRSLGGWLRRVLIRYQTGSCFGWEWQWWVNWTGDRNKVFILLVKSVGRRTVSLTSSPDSVMGICHQMTMGGELLLLLSSALYHEGSSCDYRQLLPQLLIEHYLLLLSPFWLMFGKRSTCCMWALLVIPGRDDWCLSGVSIWKSIHATPANRPN